MKASLQLSVALLCLCFSFAALDLQKTAQINQKAKALQNEKVDIALKYYSTRDLSSKVLDKGMSLVEQLEEMVEEHDLEEEVPSVTEFVKDLKIFLKETKEFTNERSKMYGKEFVDIEIKLLKLLGN